MIQTGDARELSRLIPDCSVDLIFTDPVYDRRDDYLWLAQEAIRVLKPAGAALCWSNGKWHRQNATWLEEGGLTYRWDFACVRRTGGPMCGKIISKTNRLLWMDVNGGSRMLGYLPDGYDGLNTGDWGTLFKWAKHPRFSASAVRAFSAEGAMVFDPFAGGGTVPAVCKAVGRDFIAFEIDPETTQAARERLGMIQPLFDAGESQSVLPLTAEPKPMTQPTV